MLPILALALPFFQTTAPVHTHGHMVGEVRKTSAVVGTRSDRKADAQLELSKSKDMASAQLVQARLRSQDFSFHFELQKLDADTKYYYRTTLIDPTKNTVRSPGPVLSFRTAPEASADVKFVAACEFYEQARYPGVRALESEAADFFLMLGDLPYADKFGAATTLEDYRAKHAAIHVTPDWISFLEKTPFFGVFDDHEIQNDWDAKTDPALARAGLAAWGEWKPILVPSTGQYYRSFAWGADLRVFLLDTRTKRDSNLAPDRVGHSMLGVTQKAWLLRELEAAKESFKLVVTSVPLRSGWKWRDHWEGYQRERSEIFAALRSKGIEGVAFLSGDHHFSARNHHAEGFPELIVGALAAHHNKPPLERDPVMVESRTGPCYMRGRVFSKETPKRLLLEIVRDGKAILEETVYARPAVDVSMLSATGSAAFVVDGPRTARVRARASRRVRVDPGKSRVQAAASDGRGRVITEAFELELPPGGKLAVGVLPHATAASVAGDVLREDFEGDALRTNSQTFDVGPVPSAWFVDGGRLWQSSRVESGRDGQPGAQIVFGDALGDQCVRARVRSWGPESFGVLARHVSAQDYYTLEFNPRKQRVRFGVCAMGVYKPLFAETRRLENYRSYEVELRAVGDVFVASLDGVELFRLEDKTHARGKPGLACNSVNLVAFDELAVTEGPDPRSALLDDAFEGDELQKSWKALDGALEGEWLAVFGRAIQQRYVADKASFGSNLVHDALPVDDVAVRAEVSVRGAGRVGLWSRVTRDGRGYRGWIDPARRTAALELFDKGKAKTLASASELQLEVERRHELEIVNVRDVLVLRVDGVEVLRAADTTIVRGRMGLHTWAQSTASFERVRVERITDFAPIATLVADARDYRYRVSVPEAKRSLPSPVAVLMISDRYVPPIDLASLDLQMRLLPLAARSLLQATIGFVRAPLDAEGRLSVPLRLPKDPALRGSLVLGGVVLHGSAQGFKLRPLPSVFFEID